MKFLFYSILLSITTFAADNPALKKAIDGVLNPSRNSDLSYGIYAVSLKTQQVIYEKNANELLIPASVNKVFTAYTALKKLKATSTFKTGIYAAGSTREGKFVGDIYLKGGGDPSLVSERMWMLVNEFLRSGITHIMGNLVGDDGFYDRERTPESRPHYLKDQAYNAPVGALSFNFNTTTVYVKPGEAVGKPPTIYIDPRNPYIDVVNQAKTSGAGSNTTIQVNRTDYVKGDLGDTVLLRGNIPIDGDEVRFYRNIVNPTLYTVHMFKNFLEERGVKVDGKILEGTVPKHAKQLIEFDSLPMWQIVWGMNKFSNNFVADQITKKIGAEMWGVPGTLQKGVTSIEDALEDIGIKRNSYQIKDGSGLTRNTKVSAKQIVTVLKAAQADFTMGPEFQSSLGIGSEDGTLRRRFLGAKGTSFIRAKTGSLDGVASLAGYGTTKDGELLAFAVILNDPKMKYGKMSAWVDQVVTAILKNVK